MKEDVLKQYKENLANDPDNLKLRKTLAEMNFLERYKKEAIEEYPQHTYKLYHIYL